MDVGLNFWVTTFTLIAHNKNAITKLHIHHRLHIVVNDTLLLIIGGRLLVEYEIQKEDLQIRSENGISRAICKVLKYWIFKTTGHLYHSMTNNNNQYSFISWTIFIDCISSSNGVPCHKYFPTNVSLDFCWISVLFLWSHQFYRQNNGCPYYYASYCNYFNCKPRGKKRKLILGRLCWYFGKRMKSMNFNFFVQYICISGVAPNSLLQGNRLLVFLHVVYDDCNDVMSYHYGLHYSKGASKIIISFRRHLIFSKQDSSGT